MKQEKVNHPKLLAVLGSPHADGTTAAMLKHAVHAAQQAGYEVTELNLYDKQIGYCKGCRLCLRDGNCIQQDDMPEIAQLLRECHTVILAAPTYWANIPAPVKNFFDRSLGNAMEETAAFPKPRLQGKTYMLLTACNTPYPFSWLCGQSRGAIRSMDEFFKTAGMRCLGKFTCADAAKRKELPKPLVKRIERCLQHHPPAE